MDRLSENTIPWHLISSALQDNLSPEEDAAFQQWIASGAQNRELFMQLKDAWHNGLDDYPVYLQANETIAWNALRSKLEEQVTGEKDQQAMTVDFTRKRRARLIRIVSIAAVFVIATGFVIWYMMANSSTTYKTGNSEQQSVSLADGTVIKLFPATSIEVPADYNQSVRKVQLKNGDAFFEVQHREDIPFIVDLGTASVKDIGTSFSIQKTNGSINVSVVTGKAEFRNHANNQVHLLTAGMHLRFVPASGNSRSLIFIDSLATHSENRLLFVNTSLPEVISRFIEVYNKQIVIIDTAITQKRFTGHLEGQSFEGAMDVLCKSLNIAFIQENDVYYLKKE